MPYTPVSVIIPTYNRADKLPASIDSVLRQSHKELEVIVVDDGSMDETERVVASITDNRLRYHRLEKNGGAAHARNVGVALARYDLIAFNDSDDLWHPQKLATQLSFWSGHPEDILTYCAYKVDLPSGGIIKIPETSDDPDTLQGNIFYYLLLRPTIGTPTMLMAKHVFQQAGGFDVSYPACEDWEFTIRVSRLGSIGYLDDILLTVEAAAADRLSASRTAYYQARCMMLAAYQKDINAIGQFDLYAGDILKRAERENCTESVKQTMMYYLAKEASSTICETKD